MKNLLCIAFIFLSIPVFAQSDFAKKDTLPPVLPVDSLAPIRPVDTVLRITDLNPYFSLHVDSSLNYPLQINKPQPDYFWYLKSAPVGVRIGKDNGLVTFRADKAYFLSGRLKYDVEYKVAFGVQNLRNPAEKVDTSFTLVFYNTDIIPAKVKPTVSSIITIEEGQTASFRVFCDAGSFPVENIVTLTSFPLSNYQPVLDCGEEFKWAVPYDFVKETDSGKVRSLVVSFIGTTRTQYRDTASVRIIVRDALNYPVAIEEFNQAKKNVQRYVLNLKYTFLQLDRKVKKTKNTRTAFDLTSTSTSLTGTVMATSSDPNIKKRGQIFPSVGLALVPIKEAAAPNKVSDQNQASLIRTSIKRLEYMLQDYQLVSDRDPAIVTKTTKLRDELKTAQIQLIDVPDQMANNMTEEELNRYFNSPKVNKKYRLTTK